MKKKGSFSAGYHDSPVLWKQHLVRALEEDQFQYDWTTLGITNITRRVTAQVVAKSAGVWASQGLVLAANALAIELGWDLQIRMNPRLQVGDRFSPGVHLCNWVGEAHAVLRLERAFLNLAAYASGIAYKTRGMIEQIEHTWRDRGYSPQPPRLTSTRKTLPGYRDVSVLAVMAGGGQSHRVSLGAGVLIKENHIAAAGGIGAAILGARKVAPHGLRIEIEVRNLKELEVALAQGVDAVLLDNFQPAEVARAIEVIESRRHGLVTVEVSGGIDSRNLEAFLLPGVHVISSGGLTHSVQVTDLSLLIDWKKPRSSKSKRSKR